MDQPKPLSVLRGHEDSVNSVHYVRTSLLSGSGDGQLKVWNTDSRRCTTTIRAHDVSLQSIDYINQKELVLSSGRDGSIKLWSEQLQLINTFPGCQHFCNISCDRSQKDQNIVASASDCTFKTNLWDIRENSISPILSINCKSHGMVMSLLLTSNLSCFHSPDNNSSSLSLLVGSEDGILSIFDIRQNGIVGELNAHSQPVFAIDACPCSGSRIITGAADKEVILTESNADCQSFIQRKHHFNLPEEGTSCIRYRSDSRLIASTHWDSTVRLFDKKLKPLGILRHHRSAVNSVAFNDFGETDTDKCQFATGSKDGTIALWSMYASSYKH